MRKVKWLFFGYIAFVLLVIAGIGIAFDAAPPRDPNTFYAAYGGAIKSLDPAEVNDTLGGSILSYIFEGLYNYKYKATPYEIVPEIAADMPTTSADGLTMTIHVRPGIHYYDPEKTLWHDGIGPEITAEDFVYSFKRVCDFNLASDNYSFIFQGNFKGLEDWWQYTRSHTHGDVDYDRPVEAFTAPDPHTLVLRFSHPYPQMIYNLVNCPTAPVCRAMVEHWKDQIRKHPVGTGPYALAENLRDERIVLTANPTYRFAGRVPHIKRFQLDYFSEDMPVWMLFKQGLFDVAGIPKDAYSQAIAGGGDLTPEMIARGVSLTKHTDPATSYIGFNMTDPVLGKNKPLRQAMSMAFDRSRFIEKFANGRGVPAIGPIPPGFPTYDPNRINPYTQYNLPAARKLMTDAVRIHGGPIPPLHILFRGADTIDRQMADFYVELMSQIGLTLVPEFRDFARWQEMVDNHEAQLFDGGWDADYPDEQDFLQLFYGKNAGPNGLNNVAYVNPVFDAMYERAAVMQDTPERRKLYLQMQQMVEDDCPWLIIDYGVTFDLSYDWIKNRSIMDYGHGFMQYYTLNSELRAKSLRSRQ
jgi:oligopeptide transport system substrate-binding protein